jgi:hypothetical protein
MTVDSQKSALLSHLIKYGWITPIKALEKYGCFRLAARIFELREVGHPIETQLIHTKDGKKYAKYLYRK